MAKALIAKWPQSAAGGPLAAGGTRYGCDIWSEGTNYSAVDSPGGPLSRGDCPQRDNPSEILESKVTNTQTVIIVQPLIIVSHS